MLNYKNIFDSFFHSYLNNSSIQEYLHLHARIHYVYGGTNWLGEHQKYYVHDQDVQNELAKELLKELKNLSDSLNISSSDMDKHAILLVQSHHGKSYFNTLDFYEYYGNSSTHGVFQVHFLDIGKQLFSPEIYSLYQESFNEYQLKKNKKKKNFKF